MIPKLFPKHITIDLEKFHQDGLQQLAGLLPHEDAQALIKIVISRGLVAMLTSEFERHQPSVQEIAGNMQDAKGRMNELRSHGIRPFPAPGVLYRRRQRALQEAVNEQQNQHEPDPAEVFNDLQPAEDEDVHAMPHRHVEQYLWVLLPEEMRQSFEDFLDAHPGVDENDALRLLLARALDQEEQREQTPGEKKAAELLRLAEKLYARSKRRCG